MGSFVHVIKFIMIRFTQQDLCCISKSTMNHVYIYSILFFDIGLKIEPPLIKLWLLEVHVCWILNWIHKFSIVCTIECRVVIKIWRHSPISLKHVSLWHLLFNSHWTIYQSNIGGLIRKTSHLRSIYITNLEIFSFCY
jgi:membrane associated rhomboid family serine protease